MNATGLRAFGAWLKNKRGDASIAAFAQRIGVSRSALQRYETGENKPPAELLLSLQKQFDDFPELGDSSAQYPNPTMGHHRVEEERAQYRVAPDMTEFERRLDAMKRAQAAVTTGLAGYGLAPPQHITFHQLLTHLIVQHYVTPEGLAELIQWYAFENKPKSETRA